MRDAFKAAAIDEMIRIGGEHFARRCAQAFGSKQAMAEIDRLSQVKVAARLLGVDERKQIRNRLIDSGLSKSTANRRISAALGLRRPLREPAARHAQAIATETRPSHEQQPEPDLDRCRA